MVTPHIDPSQYNFPEAVGHNFAHIVIDVFCGTTRGAPSHHRDDAVGAEIVAAIMDLDEAAGVEGVEGGVVTE